jgi:hypothetical protein
LTLGFGLFGSACTFTGLGDYDVETCASPTGTSSTVQKVGSLSDLTFSSASGNNVIGAFTSSVTGGTCLEAVNAKGYLQQNANCLFLSSASELALSAHQPMIVPLSGGYAATFVATTAPCTAGQIEYRFSAASVYGAGSLPCETTGSSLPAVVPLSDGSTVLMAWYATSYATRSDPIDSCTAAQAAPLKVIVVTAGASGSPVVGSAMDLGDTGISVRSPAIAPVPGQPQAILASPFGNDVGVWNLSATSAPGQPVAIPSLAGARAVAVAVASDNSGRIAIAAEIGCNPQSISLAVGTLTSGFSKATVVAPADGSLAVAPSVAWRSDKNEWVVGWVSSSGGAHVLARSFDATGAALDAALDPSTQATAASVTSDGNVLGFVASASSFVSTSLGCTP